MEDNYAEVVYIGGDDLSISGDSGDRVYILDSKPDAAVDSDDNDYYEYDAIVNGKNTTIKANDDDIFEQVGLYQNVSYDSNDYVNRAKLVEGTGNDDFKAYDLSDSDINYSNGVLSFSGVANLVLADDSKIFVNDDGDYKTTTPSKLARDYESGYTGIIYVYENDDDEALEVYVFDKTEDKDNGEETVDTRIDSVEMWADGGFKITLKGNVSKNTDYKVQLQTWSGSAWVDMSSQTVTISDGSNSVTDDGNKFVLEQGKVYKVVVNGVESNQVKGQ